MEAEALRLLVRTVREPKDILEEASGLRSLGFFSLLPRTKPALQGVLVEELTTATVSEEFRGLGFGVFGFGGFSTHSRTYLGWGV